MDRNISGSEGKSKKLNMFASTNYESEPWAQQMDELLEVLGAQGKTIHTGQPITELTTFHDFLHSQKEWVELRRVIDKLYYVNIDKDDRLWDVSEKIYDRETLKKKLG